MQSPDHPFRRDPHGGDEQPRAFFDHDVDERVELPVRVVVVRLARPRAGFRQGEVDAERRRGCGAGGGEGGFEGAD